MAKWTKKDIGAMRSMLESQWLIFKPLRGAFSSIDEMLAAEKTFRELLAKPNARLHVVESGIRAAYNRASRLYCEHCETVGNEIIRFDKGLDDELVTRFVAMAKIDDEDRKKAGAMLTRVQSEGLPEEVAKYDPISKTTLTEPNP